MRCRFAIRAVLISMGLVMGSASCSSVSAHWPAWEGFKHSFISPDGRVIDHSQTDQRSISEGQAYALFFALVAQDRTSFDRILKWTENNLSQGSLANNLPAWLWGQENDTWKILDSNSASDADLWLAYTLHEASRVWCHAPYANTARALGQLIAQHETHDVEGLGPSVLPGKVGFVSNEGTVKLNPSYVPPFLMARLADVWKEDPVWAKLQAGSQRLLLASARTGFYPDWVQYTQSQYALPSTEPRGDYDAIRVYMWIGMSHTHTPSQHSILNALTPLIRLVETRQEMPEWTEPETGQVSNQSGPEGFQVALAPLFEQLEKRSTSNILNAKGLKEGNVQTWREYGYYNAALTLFGHGYMDKRYRFGSTGQLLLGGKEVRRCG